ncbi:MULTISPECIES: amino acid adenylation domain-containing protein [unclassified Paenibacillus]|uniref:amino acid adenylation domain-containing protein n=1 Tax=unclassified Paenibacillus TaxID=185978 RepID=UPI00020D7A46|nr:MULTISPECIES: amino acid adenylation domain-containing protein [unclassified Paenibacillus]EGL17956.1 AMP-binding enzyme [Paenibacillus sp. HGF7]EPD81620.1 amino acid adenylation domain-containing protein [Paenibacillus sp. HGH0039]
MYRSDEPKFLHDYFLKFAEKTPESLAIVHHSEKWTYARLADKSRDYAERLKIAGLRTGDRVVLELDPSAEAIAVMIACSIRGFVFIPLNPDTPQERLESILTRTGARLHIQKGRSRKLSPQAEAGQAYLDEGHLLVPEVSQAADDLSTDSKLLDTNLVYLIFTSGTTGQPKGIMMTHRAVVSYFDGMNAQCALPQNTRVGSVSSLQFDFSLVDMGLAFGTGGTLVIVPRSLIFQPRRFLEHLHQQRVDLMSGVPSIWKNVLAHERQPVEDIHLHSILYGGEYCSARDLRKLQSLLGLKRIINCFGQSESIACSFKDLPLPLPDTESISVGSGMHNTEMLLVDEAGIIIREPGITGEIYLRGACLFSGYWLEEELTSSRLVPHPETPCTGEKVFKTGDLAYMDENGEFYYVSRTDNQVKIMGYRVELEEVERRLLSHPKVDGVCLIVHEGNKTELHAFMVLTDQENTQTVQQQLRAYCAEMLPSYMIPSRFSFLKEFPLNTNGKVDRKALKAMQIPTLTR